MSSFEATSRYDHQFIFNSALEAYERKTGINLTKDPLLCCFETCNSPNAILSILRAQILGPGQSQSRLTTWLVPTVNVINAFSAIIGAGVALAYPPAGVISTGIGVLLSAAKGVSDSRGPLLDLFTRIENIFRRLETYAEVPPSAGMTDTIVGVMVEVLYVLAIVTKEIKLNRATRVLKRLMGRADIENALQRLENMTQEEARMTGAEALKAIHGIGNTVGDKMHGLQDALQAVQDKVGGVEGMLQSMLQGVTGMSQGVDNRAQDIGDKVINAAPVVVTLPTAPALKPVNDIPLTRTLLKQVLSDLSERLYCSFRQQVRLVVHGGAVMVLHPHFTHRESTQEVDYIHRTFALEYGELGFPDAEQRLRVCIAETAFRFNLGANWINDHADVALPWALDQQGRRYDPIFNASTHQEAAARQTIFDERGLSLVAVPWPWAIALKLVRYSKKDPEDCGAILRFGSSQRGIRWNVAGLEMWLSERCWPMQYSKYGPRQKAQLRERLEDAITRAYREQLELPLLPPLQSSSSSSSFAPEPRQRTNHDIPLYFL